MTVQGYLDQSYYALNKNYGTSIYESNFTTGDNNKKCPMSTPLLMFFDFTEDNQFGDVENQQIVGLNDVIFTVDGSSDLERARTLRDCWTHSDKFGKLLNN